MTGRLASRSGDEVGQVGGLEGLTFGVLIFVMGMLVIANAWGVIDSKMAASAAAREGARAFVESRAPETEPALQEAFVAAGEALRGYGRDPHKMVFDAEEGRLERCSRVTIRVEYPVPLISIPLLGRHGAGFTARARHSEIVDPYRTGLKDRNRCPLVLQP